MPEKLAALAFLVGFFVVAGGLVCWWFDRTHLRPRPRRSSGRVVRGWLPERGS